VKISDEIGHLLVGGIPSGMLHIERGAIQYQGPHRQLANIPTELASAIPTENFASWARLPHSSLQEWAREVVESLERQPYSPFNSEAFEFYLPETSRPGTPQFRRWSEDAGDTSGLLLARRRRIYGAREYRFVDVKLGQIVSTCELHDIDVRRLMYALDLAANNPVRARLVREGPASEWLFTSELPRAEQRAFTAFGTLNIPVDRPFERRWQFVQSEELALGMLRSLGIVLEQQHQEDGK
jgi:hypothetical protein